MSTIEIEKSKQLAPRHREKPERPKQYQVIVESKIRMSCLGCMLREVFNKDIPQIEHHFSTISAKGKDIVMTTSKEVAETKVEEAVDFPNGRGILCGEMIKRAVKVYSQPAP